MSIAVLLESLSQASEEPAPPFFPPDDRVLTLPTARSLQEAASSFSVHEFVLFQYSTAISDQTQFSLSFSAPLFQVTTVPSIKNRFIDHQRLKVAFLVHAGALVYYPDPELQAIFTVGGGVAVDCCFDDDCRWVVTPVAIPGFLYWAPLDPTPSGDPNTGVAFPYYAGVGASINVRDWLAFLAEVSSGGAAAWFAEFCDERGSAGDRVSCPGVGVVLLANLGLRLRSEELGAEFGVISPFLFHSRHGSTIVAGEGPFVLPWLSFTYQWKPNPGVEDQEKHETAKTTRRPTR